MRRGHTLLELSAVLALAATSVAWLAPAARGWRDRSSVVAAREAVAGLVARARTEALLHGGASVHVASDPWRAWIRVGDSIVARVSLEHAFGVDVLLSRDRRATELPYDALGLGRIASETLGFARGEAGSGLVVSGYGRVRRR